VISAFNRRTTMKTSLLPLLAMLVVIIGGCAGPTPIKKLALPPVSIIEGEVTQLDENGFTLTDHSGSIYVRAKLPADKKLSVAVDENVRVYGNLEAGRERIFDGYVIRKTTGEQIIVSNPTPHIGFILQTSFQ